MTEPCPFCQTNVMFLSSICPSCRNDRDTATPENTALWAEVMARRDAEVKQAAALIPQGNSVKAMAARDMAAGALWLAGGGAITLITYLDATQREGGGGYLVAYGPMIYGAFRFLRGLFTSIAG